MVGFINFFLGNSVENKPNSQDMRDRWSEVQKNGLKKTVLIADTTSVTPRPFSSDSVQLFRAQLPKGVDKNQFIFSQNGLPMNSIVLNISLGSGNVFLSDKIARAALKANPNIKFIIPLQEIFKSTEDVNYKKHLKNIANSWQIPEKNIVLVSSRMGAWPQDGIAFGGGGVVRADLKLDPNHKVTAHEATDIASALGLSVVEESDVGRFGDTQLFSKKDGSQVVVFGSETMDRVLTNKFGLHGDSNSDRMIAIGLVMKQFSTKGVSPSNILPIGKSKLTYGDVLNKMSSADKRKIDPICLKEFKKRHNLPFPEENIKYHSDLVVFSAGNDVAFINETDKQKYPELSKQLLYSGLQPVSLPSINTNNRSPSEIKKMEEIGIDLVKLDRDTVIGGDVKGSYLNAISGIMPDGKTAILMPTESNSLEHLTQNDKNARNIILESVPNSIVIPIGGSTALQVYGSVPLKTGGLLAGKDYGPHCLSKLTPFIIQPIMPKTIGDFNNRNGF